MARCSADLGKTWGKEIPFTKTPRALATGSTVLPVGAITPAGGGESTLAMTAGERRRGRHHVNVATLTTNPSAPTTVTPISSVSTAPGKGLALPTDGSPYLAVNGTSAVFYDSSGVLWLTYSVGQTSGAKGKVSQIVVDRSCNNGVDWLATGQYMGTLGEQGVNPGLVPVNGTMGISAQWGGSPPTDAGAPTVSDIFYRMSP